MNLKSLKRKTRYLLNRIYTNETILIFTSENSANSSTIASIRNVSEGNVFDVLDFQSKKYIDIFREFLLLGDCGYYAYLNDKCVHRSWVKSNEQIVYPHWAYPLKLRPDQCFIHYCETAPQARGQGVYPAVLSKIVHDFKHKGDIIMSINAENIASIIGAEKAGFVERERIHVCVILGFKYIIKQDSRF